MDLTDSPSEETEAVQVEPSQDLDQAEEKAECGDTAEVESGNANNSLKEKPYEIRIFWTSLTYSENGEEPVKIYIQPPRRYGQPFTFYIPGADRWSEVMPSWASRNRDEIVRRIKDECSHYFADWVEG